MYSLKRELHKDFRDMCMVPVYKGKGDKYGYNS